MVDTVDISSLPSDVRERIAQLDLELSEGDITQKGYDKKRQLLLGPYLRTQREAAKAASSPSTRAQRKHQRRLTRDESRFHSEIRAEAVQQALAEYSEGKKEKPNILPPVKRRGTETKRERHRASDSSSEDDSMFGSTDRSKDTSSTVSLNELQRKSLTNGSQKSDAPSRAPPPPDVTTTTVANGASIRKVFRDRRKQRTDDDWQDREVIQENERVAIKTVVDKEDSILKNDVIYANDVAESDVAVTNVTSQDYQNAVVLSSLSALKPVKVSLKIQQLVHSLQVIVVCPF
uniref:DMAP1-binding domain-containing protein n=1 Tax=Setaria digitata TaxID=48799 RepID=A0A915Q4P1_9BILA